MWHALIRGSVFSSIRTSSPLPSHNPSTESLSSPQPRPAHPSSIDNCNKTSPVDANTSHPSHSRRYGQNKNTNTVYDDYNLNNWMNKGINSSMTLIKDESLPTTQHLENVTPDSLDTSLPTSSLRSLRANRPLFTIATSRQTYSLNRSPVLIGPGGQIRREDNGGSCLDNNFTDDDCDDNAAAADDDDGDDDDDNASMNGTGRKYDDDIMGTTDSINSQRNDKKHQRQATIITIPPRAPKRSTKTATTTSTKKKLKEKNLTEPKHTDRPKKKRRWENVSPPSSPTKMNYEVSMATIATPPNKRKPATEDVPRPHACPLCDRRFNRRYNLTAHIRVHDPDRKKLFDCPSCNQSFDRKHDRDRHADALHFEHKHRCYCHLCDASFTRRDALTRHVHKLHTQAQSPTSSGGPSSTTL